MATELMHANLDYEQMIKLGMERTGLSREEFLKQGAEAQAESEAELKRLLAEDAANS